MVVFREWHGLPCHISYITMDRCNLNVGPTYICGMGDGLATNSWVGLVDVGGPPPLPPDSTGGAPALFWLTCRGAASRRLPIMEKLSRNKWPVASVHISSIRYGHLTGIALVNTCPQLSYYLSLNEFQESRHNCELVAGLRPQLGVHLLCLINNKHELIYCTVLLRCNPQEHQ